MKEKSTPIRYTTVYGETRQSNTPHKISDTPEKNKTNKKNHGNRRLKPCKEINICFGKSHRISLNIELKNKLNAIVYRLVLVSNCIKFAHEV